MHRNTTSRFGSFLTAGLVAGTRARTLCVVAVLALAGQVGGLGCAQAREAEAGADPASVAAAEAAFAKVPFAKWGAETLAQIDKDLGQPGSALYAEYGTPDGRRPGKRAYQSSVPIQAAVLFYQIRKDEAYLKEAQRIAAACLAEWVRPSGGLRETGQWGGSDLVDALLDLYQVDKDPRWLTAVRRMLEFLHEKGRDPNGRYGAD